MELFQKVLQSGLLFLGALFLSALAVQSAEAAATLDGTGGVYTFTGAVTGESITLSVSGGNHVLADTSNAITLSGDAIANCVLSGANKIATCTTAAITSIAINSGNGGDSVTITDTTKPVAVTSGTGDDDLLLTDNHAAVTMDPGIATGFFSRNRVWVDGNHDTLSVSNGSVAVNYVEIGRNSALLNNIAGDMSFADYGNNDIIYIYDYNAVLPRTYTVTAGATSFNGITVSYPGFEGQTEIRAGNGIDILNIEGTLASSTLRYYATGGIDQVSITDSGSVQNILGYIEIRNVVDAVIDDSADTTGRTLNFDGYYIDLGFAPGDISFNDGANNLTIDGGTGADTFNISGTADTGAADDSLTLNTGDGNDIINFHNSNTITSGDFAADILTLNGQGGTNTLNLSDSSGATARTVTWTSTTITGTGTVAPIDYSNFTTLSYNQGTNNDSLTATSLPSGFTLTLDQGAGTDTVASTNLAGTLNITGGTGTDTISTSATFSGGTLTLADAYNLGTDVTTDTTGASTINGAGTLSLNGTIAFTVGDSASALDLEVSNVLADGTSAGAITKAGAGRLKLLGANTYTGAITANAGQLLFANNTAAGTGLVTIGGSAQGELTGTTSLGNNFSLNTTGNPALIADASATTTAISGSVTLNQTDNVIDVEGAQLILSGVISQSGGTRALGKIGAGTLVLAASTANTYAGNTNINAGTLQLGSSGNNLANTGGNVTVVSGAVFDVNDKTETVGHVAGAGDLDLGSGTLTLGGNGNSPTFSGVISGTGNLVVNNGFSAEWHLSGSSTYTGTTTINTGIVYISNADALGTVTGGTVVIGGAALYLETNSFSLAEPLSIAFDGPIFSCGSLTSWSGGLHTITGSVTLTDNTCIRAWDGSPMTISGVISGSAGLEIYAGNNGTDAITLTGNNTYTGLTRPSVGKTLINGNQPSSDVYVVNNDTVLGGTGTIGELSFENNSTTTLAPGTSPGTINTGAVTFDDASILSLELNGTTAGTQYDRVISSGTVVLGSATLAGTFGYTPNPGDIFTIVSGTSVTGTFNGLPNNTGFIFGGYPVYITYTATTVTLTRFATSSGGGGGGSFAATPVVTMIQPSPATGTKPVNQSVACRLTDTNVANPGLVTGSAKMRINGINVNASQVVISSFGNSNGNTNTNSTVTIMDLTYSPVTNFTSNTTVNVHCEVDNNNSLQGSGDFQFSVGTQLANTNTNTNGGPGNGNVNGGTSNSNTNSGNANTNGGSVGGDYFFTDIANHWASLYIDDLQSKCNVNGYQDGQGNLLHLFKPDAQITRGELIIMLTKCKVGLLQKPDTKPFPDVAKDHWAAAYIAKAKEFGIVSGYLSGPNKGKFLPNQNATRAEALKMILLTWFNAGDVGGAPATPCPDVKQTEWYAKYFNYALNKKIVEGYKDANGNPTGMCGPSKNVTRAESAKMIVNTKGLINF